MLLQKVSHDGREDLAVRFDCHSLFDGDHGQSDTPGVCLQRCGRREFFDEFGHQELVPILDALREPDLGERATDERNCSHEAPMEDGSGASATPTFPVFRTSNAMSAVLSTLRNS